MADQAYFTKRALAFLKQLRDNNNRDWFQANKDRYEHEVKEPFLRLIADLAPGLKKINPHMVADPAPSGGSMMRIYRDIRFSKDKSPYKTYIAAHFLHDKGKEGASPAYYLHLEPDGSTAGGGLWQPEPRTLKKVRDRIVADAQAWRRATSGSRLGQGCRMGGESLKRPPAGYDPAHPFIEDIKRKDFVIGSALTDADVCGADFRDVALDRFRSAAPFIEFLSKAAGLP